MWFVYLIGQSNVIVSSHPNKLQIIFLKFGYYPAITYLYSIIKTNHKSHEKTPQTPQHRNRVMDARF
jgi:hypothetical protein